MHHQVASRCVLHDKTNMLLRLETREQVDQERMANTVDRFENPLLAHQTGKERRPCELQLIFVLAHYSKIKNYNYSSNIKKKTLKHENVYLSTSSRATMSPFFRALIANISPVLLYSANNTWKGEAERM